MKRKRFKYFHLYFPRLFGCTGKRIASNAIFFEL